MADNVGPFRDAVRLTHALSTIDDLMHALGDRPAGSRGAFDMQRLDWLDLRNMLIVARSVAQAALGRTESRGAHQRENSSRHAARMAGQSSGSLARGSTQPGANTGCIGGSTGHDVDCHAESLARNRPVRRPLGNLQRALRAGTMSTGWPALYPYPRRPFARLCFSCINANACKECMMRDRRRNALRLYGAPRAFA